MAIQVIQKGLYTVFQDLGRSSYQSLGLSPSTPMDEELHYIANQLVGNVSTSPTIEFFMMGPTLKALDSHMISITGDIEWVKINNCVAPCNAAIQVEAGDIIKIGPFVSGCRGYIAIKGISDLQEYFGSVTYDSKMKMGQRIENGLIIQAEVTSAISYKQLKYEALERCSNQKVRVIKGADFNRFSESGVDTFLANSYTMSENSNRMGIRFNGERIEHKDTADILSRPLVKGTIQVPSLGEPIIMMSDHQPTGGYTVIGIVCQADLWKLAQLKPKQNISFEFIEVEEAIRIKVERKTLMEKSIENNLLKPRYFTIAIGNKQFDVEVREHQNED